MAFRPRKHGPDFELPPAGERFLTGLGVDVDVVRRQRRLFACCCLDWTENRHHLGGALGAALARHCFAKRWVTKRKEERGLQVTAGGHRAFADHFGISTQR